MLKRKSGNLSSNTITKRIKKAKSHNEERNKYEQKTILQTICFLPQSTTLEKFSLHPQTYGIISSYLRDYKKKIKTKSLNSDEPQKPIIIQGPSGCGKTYFVRQIAIDFNLRILELNVSSLRNYANVRRILGEASQTFSIDQGENIGTIIFIDDIDIILEPDKGFYKGIESVIGIAKCPIIMTCENIPEVILNNKCIKIYRLENYKERILEFIFKIKNSDISDLDLRNAYTVTSGNLHRISNFLYIKVRCN